MQAKYYGKQLQISQQFLFKDIFYIIYINMDKLTKLNKIKELIIKKLELATDDREIQMLNNNYIIIISIIYNYQNKI